MASGASTPRRGGTRADPTPLARQNTIPAPKWEPTPDPWTPIVLSLDGGGVRGLSALFIIRRIMERIKEKLVDEGNPDDDPIRRPFPDDSASLSSSTKTPVADPSTSTVPATDSATTEVSIGTGPDLRASVDEGSTGVESARTEQNGALHGSNDPETSQAYIDGGTDLPLPCYFFDFIIGTSTGGLIAVMLGLLRMSVDECIMEYWKFSNSIFYPRRKLRAYDARKIETACQSVVKDYCNCHREGDQCDGNDYLRQYDYKDFDLNTDSTDPEARNIRNNRTCKIGLISQRKSEAQGPSPGGLALAHDNTYLWRSYNHGKRATEFHDEFELNPKDISGDRSCARIWQACRASTAAPGYFYYFKRPKIGNHMHMDGGMGNNNPSDYAMHEAGLRTKFLTGPRRRSDRDVAMMVSVGTGQHGEESRFSTWTMLKWMTKQITNTEKQHIGTRALAQEKHCDYYRFTVPHRPDNPGLSKMKMTACERSRKKSKSRTNSQTSSIQDPSAGNSPSKKSNGKDKLTTSPTAETWYAQLLEKAKETGKKRGFRPDLYDYTTFEELFEKTEEYYTRGRYCNPVRNIGVYTPGYIDQCADRLIEYAKARRNDDEERWKCFISHPHPDHPMYLESYLKPRPVDDVSRQ